MGKVQNQPMADSELFPSHRISVGPIDRVPQSTAEYMDIPIPIQTKDTQTIWANLDQLAVQIEAHWQDDMSAVDAVRDVRREL